MTHLSVVIPVFNECSLIHELIKRVEISLNSITEDFEIILVDDGSQDSTWNEIEYAAKNEKRIKGIKFSRNFGHHYAITAGLETARGQWIVVMDGDLQDRPEVIPELYLEAQLGFDIVFVSRENRPEKFYYLVLQKIFYWFLVKFSGINFDSRQANFSIINRKVLNAFNLFPDNARFYGSTIKWLGFKRSSILANHGQRFAGKPSYTLKKRLRLATDIITSFSERPINLSITTGATLFSLINFYLLFNFISNRSTYSFFELLNWNQVSSDLLLFASGMILLILSVYGIYLKNVFREVKKRPLYIISDTIN